MSGQGRQRNTVEELEKVLQQEIELYRTYAATLSKDSDLMATLKVEELEKSNKVKNTLLLKLKALDQARQNLVRQFAVAHQMSEENIRIADICERVSSAEAMRLKTLRDELQSIILELKGIQHSTISLAQTSLNWVNSTISSLHRLLSPTGTYNLQGKVARDEHFTGRVVVKQI